MMSEAKHMSGLTRGLNMRRTSNKIVVAGFAIALTLYLARALSEEWMVGNPMTVAEAVASAFAVFIAWALARELDPDHPWPAAVAMIASFVAALWFVPAILVVGSAAIALRMVSGTVARSLTMFDLGLMAVIGFGSGRELSFWSIAIFAFVALKVAPEFGRLRWWTVGTLTGGFVAGWYTGELSPVTVSAQTAAIAVAFLLVGAIAALRVSVSAKTDARPGLVEDFRLVMSRMAASVILASATLIGGFDAMWKIAPVGVALTVVALVSLIPPLAGPTTDGLKPRTSVPLSRGTGESATFQGGRASLRARGMKEAQFPRTRSRTGSERHPSGRA
jgi:hypothetical protein